MRTLLLLLMLGVPAHAQVHGHASVMLDAVPNVDAAEMRTRFFAERTLQPHPNLTVNLGGFIEGLVAYREDRVRSDAIVRPQELFVELAGSRGDLRVGMGRLVWGRLDEVQPSDVVNPLDVARFFFEGRAEARLPVAFARARFFFPGETTLETVVVPWFRRGRFDEIGERFSPFNLEPRQFPIERTTPPVTARNVQAGARLSSTMGHIDWAVAAFRGTRPFPLFELVPPRPGVSPQAELVAQGFNVASLREHFGRFTMLAADFETTYGAWGLRGEAAAFVDDDLQTDQLRTIRGRSLDSGVGFDRKAGAFTMMGTLLIRRQFSDEDTLDRMNVSIVGGATRSFMRETRTLRLFSVYDTSDRSVFIRGIAAFSLRDNVSLEGSAGWFVVDEDHIRPSTMSLISRFAERDFLYARFKFFF